MIQIHNRCGPLFYLHTDHVRINVLVTLSLITILFLSQYQELQDTMVSWVEKWSSSEKNEVRIHEVKYVLDVLFPEVYSRNVCILNIVT